MMIQKFLGLSLCLASAMAHAEAIQKGITLYTTSNWSKVQIVNINNPSLICRDFGKVVSGTTLALNPDELNSQALQPCFASNSFGLIFYGNVSERPFAPQFAKPGQRCTASYQFLQGLSFNCTDM